jgi:hypothetical protein
MRIWELRAGQGDSVPSGVEQHRRWAAELAAMRMDADPAVPVQRIEFMTAAERRTLLMVGPQGGATFLDLDTGKPLIGSLRGSGRLEPGEERMLVEQDGTQVEVPVARLPWQGAQITVIGYGDGTLRISNSESDEMPDKGVSAHDGQVVALAAVGLYGRPIAFSGGSDRTVRVWDMVSHRQLDVIEMVGEVTAIKATTDGYLAVAAGGEVIVFRHIDNVLKEDG